MARNSARPSFGAPTSPPSGTWQGVVKKNDLKVKQLATPGVGVLIEAGVGIVLNKYQTSPNESYVVSNPSTHTDPLGFHARLEPLGEVLHPGHRRR